MRLKERVSAFIQLGSALQAELKGAEIEKVFHRAFAENPWFSPENARMALESISRYYLNEKKIIEWVSLYDIPLETVARKIGIVMAGNIPLVGWHDLMAVIISGNKAMIKLSSKDQALPKYVIGKLLEAEPGLKEYIEIADKLQNFDAVIATGSGNTARYFEYYFAKYPHIIRQNRTSAAILSGAETREDLYRLGEDIFTYFGLGCRNVSHLFVPDAYDFIPFFEAIEPYSEIANHNKYFNNYEYHKSLLLLNKEPHFDNGFLLLRESAVLESPVASLYYSYYHDIAELYQEVGESSSHIQCLLSAYGDLEGTIPFGTAQHPELWDYADKVDTMKFLLGL